MQSLRRDGRTIEILTSAAEDLARELLLRDRALTDLEITGAGLEEAFLTLTASRPDGEHARGTPAARALAGGAR